MPRQRPVTVVLVDDEPLIRSALSRALARGGLELVGEAATGEDAVEIVVAVRPDVVLMDLRLPGISGVEVIKQLSLLAPASRILVLTRSEENRVVEAIVAGATGYILKNAAPDAVVSAVLSTAAGESVLSPQIAGRLLRAHPRPRSPRRRDERQRRGRDPCRPHRPRTRDLHPTGQRQEQPRDRTRPRAQLEHRRQPHREHPRQTPPRKPHPGSRPSGTQRHLLRQRNLEPKEPSGRRQR